MIMYFALTSPAAVAGPRLAFRIAARHPALLINFRTRFRSPPARAQAIVERMKMPGAAFAQRPEIGAGAELVLELRLVEELQCRGSLRSATPPASREDRAGCSPWARMEIAPGEVAFDLVRPDPVFDQDLRFLRDRETFPRIFAPELRSDRTLAGREPGADLAAIAPRGAIADPFRLEHDDRLPASASSSAAESPV